MEGKPAGPQEGPRRISTYPPAAATLPKRRMPKGMLELPYGTKIAYEKLKKTLEDHGYNDNDISRVKRAYVFAERVHKGKKRKGGQPGAEKEDYIVHPLSIAIRAARLELPSAAVCAALLHDTIEDAKAEEPVTSHKIAELFSSGVAPVFGIKVAELVVRLTKPKFTEEGKWVFANEPEYYRIKDHYVGTLYDQRSDAYYAFLLNSSDLQAITLKLLDNLHNAEHMIGIMDEQRLKNLRTMANKTLRLARLMLVEEDFKYLVSLFDQWGFKLPPTVNKPPPHDSVVIFPLRQRLTEKALLAHPDPSCAFITIYGSVFDAFASGFVEVGIPPHLNIKYRQVLEKYLPDGLFCEQAKSLVPETFPTHEIIFRIQGFDFNKKPADASQKASPQLFLPGLSPDEDEQGRPAKPNQFRKSIKPSMDIRGFVEILGKDGKPVISISEEAFTLENIALGPEIAEEFFQSKEKYDALSRALSQFYDEVVRPELERQTLPPGSTNPLK